VKKTLFTIVLSAASLSAQSSDGIKLGDDVTFSASLRSRVYFWDWFAPAGPYQNQYEYSGNLLRLKFTEKTESWDFDEDIAVPMIFGLPAKATAPAPQGALGLGSNDYGANLGHSNTALAFPKELYGRYHFDKTQTLQVGRYEFNDATEIAPKNATLNYLKQNRISQRLIGTFSFSDVGRSFDGLHYDWQQPGNQDFTFVAATPTRGVFQTDGWGWNRIGFGYAAYTKEWGHGRHVADTRFFVIDYDDFRPILKTDNRPLAVRKSDTENINIQTYGMHSIHALATSAGTFDAVGWFAGQTGKWGTETQRALAFDAEAGFQPAILPKLKPWLEGGYTYGSGDGNPNDHTHGTFFQILPTPRPYARFPFFNMMNVEDAFGSLILRPSSKVTVSSEYHSLRLTNVNDFWYAGGGAYQPQTFGYTGRATSGRRSLANLYDTQVDYRVSRHMTFTGYVGYAQGLAVMKFLYPADKDGRFGYLEALFRM
jgi:hypothetical protein